MYKNNVDLIGFVGSDPESHQLEGHAIPANRKFETASARTVAINRSGQTLEVHLEHAMLDKAEFVQDGLSSLICGDKT